jgi:hypothetical protein
MLRKSFALVVAAAGIMLAFSFLAADAIGLGGSPGFGFRQILGATTGLLLIAVGIAAWPKADDVRHDDIRPE